MNGQAGDGAGGGSGFLPRVVFLVVATAALVALACFALGGRGEAIAMAGLVVLSLWRPYAALLLLALALPLYGAAPGGPRLAWAEVQTLALLAGFGLRAAAGRERVTASRLDLPLVGYLIVTLGSLLPLRYHPPSTAPESLAALCRHLFRAGDTGPWFALKAGLGVASAGALALVVTALVRRHGRTGVERALLVAVLATVVLGLLDHAGWLGLRALRPIHPLYVGRLHSVFHHPAWLAQWLLLVLPWLGGRLAAPARGERLAAVAALGLGVLTIVLTLQRGAWIALGAALGVLVWLERARFRASRRTTAVVAASLALAVLVPFLASPAVRARAGSLFTDMSNRSLFWRPVAAMVAERPWLGQGLGSFAWDYPRVVAKDDPDYLVFHGEAHNAYLMVLAERGVLGLAAYLGLLAALAWTAWRCGSRAGLLGTVALAVYGLGQYLFYVRGVELAAWLGFGLLAAAGGEPAPDRPGAKRLGFGIGAVLGAALVARAMGPRHPPAPDDRSFGLHLAEGSAADAFRWTAERADIALAVPPGGRLLELALADGHPRAEGAAPLEVAVAVDGQPIEVVRPRGPGFMPFSLWLAGGERHATSLLSLRPSRTFRPAELAETPDTRELGVALRGPALRALAAGELVGFHGVEDDEGILYRWSRGRRGVIAVGDRVGTLVLSLRAAAPDVAARPQQLRVTVGAAAPLTIALADREWREVEIPLPERRPLTVIAIEADRTWSPSRSGGSADRRELGFALGPWRVRR